MYLNVHSYFSLRYGTLSPQQLVQRAAALGIRTLALTDINTTSGVFDFVNHCRAAGIQPVVGVEFRNHGERVSVCLARNREGFAEINRHLSDYLLAKKDFPLRAPVFQNAWTIYPLDRLDRLDRLGELADGEFIGVQTSQVHQLWRLRGKIDARRLVILQPMSYADKVGFNLHKLLRAVDHNCLLARLAEHETVQPNQYLLPPVDLETAFADWPEMIENSQNLLAQCSFAFDFTTPKNRQLFTPSREDDAALLRKLAGDGLLYRYGHSDQPVKLEARLDARQRVERELAIIDELGFTAYFLITWDIIQYAHSRGYHHVGRGSGANSIVAYCLGITDVDPIELDLYFERFINPSRTSPPDFDIDFSWDERDEIIDYVFKKYGRHHVCLMATYTTFAGRSAYRELGKVFGLPKTELDALVAGEPVPGPYLGYILRYAPMLEDVPNHLGIHAGGMLIAQEPLYHYTALELPPKGFPICQFDMYVAEDIGFAKWDILSQRGLGHIKEAVELVRQNQQIHVDIHRVQDFKRDERVRRQLLAHETMGCFYIESPAMRQLLWKLGCADYPTLVAASSIIRPGVASSGMMGEYIRRHHHPAGYTAIHPVMQQILADTYGVMIYQEDVLKVAHEFAGLTLAEADLLRRAMSGKSRGRDEFARIEAKFFAGCQSKGYPEQTAREVWRQIQSFAGYSFSKAHSASFAAESYQSLYLKTYFPREFMTAVVNNGGGFYSAEFYLHEARRGGAVIEAPDLMQSEWVCVIRGETIWLGFGLIKGLEKAVVEALLRQRKQQPFRDLEDVTRRVPAGLEQLVILIRVGVFRSFGISKKELLWRAHALVNSFGHHQAAGDLFELPETVWQLPPLWQDELEDRYDEIELLGFPLRSPFELLAGPVTGITARELPEQVGRTVTITGYLITTKPVPTKTGKRMAFGYFLDAEGQYFDTTHFPHSLERYPIRGAGIYRLEGKVVLEYGCPGLEVSRLERLPFRPDPRGSSGLYLN